MLSVLSMFYVQAQEVIELNSVPSPDSISWSNPEAESVIPGTNSGMITNVSKPSLTVYLPSKEKNTGTALIIAPGGGFHMLAIDIEGRDVAKWCQDHGITAFVLKYRLVPTYGNPLAEFGQRARKNPDDMLQDVVHFIELAKADGLAAIEYVRQHTSDFNVSPDKIGIMGFSAGGTVAAGAAYEYTSADDRPDFTAPIYPALNYVEMQELPQEPMPTFIAISSDDSFGFQYQCLDMFKQWNQAQLPIEMHLYEKGGHGFGMRIQNLPSDKWIEAFGSWAQNHGFMD